MRIGVDARTLTLPEIRGMAAYVLDLMKVWPNPEDRFLLFAENPPRSEALDCPAAVSWRRVPSPRGSRFQVWDWYALPRAVRRERPDLLWSPANRAFPVPGIPQVVTVHDTLLQEKVVFADPVEGAYFRRITPLFLRGFADGIVTVSHFSAERIARVLGYPPRRIRVIHNGISIPDRPFESRKAALRFLAERGIVERDFIYALGAESPWKNTRGLLAAFREVSRRVPDAFLVVGGIQARAFDEFQGHCRALGIDGSVKLTGFVSREIRDALYRAARLFVYPSLFEGFGLPPLEAMAMGTPVVASDAASIPEAVGNAAIRVDASDPKALAGAILEMFSNAETRRRYRSLGERNIRRFRWENSARAHRRFMKGIQES